MPLPKVAAITLQSCILLRLYPSKVVHRKVLKTRVAAILKLQLGQVVQNLCAKSKVVIATILRRSEIFLHSIFAIPYGQKEHRELHTEAHSIAPGLGCTRHLWPPFHHQEFADVEAGRRVRSTPVRIIGLYLVLLCIKRKQKMDGADSYAFKYVGDIVFIWMLLRDGNVRTDLDEIGAGREIGESEISTLGNHPGHVGEKLLYFGVKLSYAVHV
ncbi:hypothetical protein DFH07DRAFT_774706 [Mycena maculata]|uniref:Uncharacterized protein n=1 Tax=Mycena maculata TaxID=230809 RepID=A0AAD7NAP9_9AGAR|nr:hypothetical protein DFH07DRAFT_774706 [Mycena maculata]